MFNNHPLLLKLKKNFASENVLIKGIVKKKTQIVGYLYTDLNEKFLISIEQIKQVMHGDKVVAKIILNKDKKIIKFIKLVEPILNQFVGKIKIKNKKIFIFPENDCFEELIVCQCDSTIKKIIDTNDLVLAKLIKHKLNGYKFFTAKIIKIIVQNKNYLTPWFITLMKYNLDNKPPLTNLNYTLSDNINKRIDLTNINFITIDNASTKDIDDALFIEKNNFNEFVLTIAIADPTAYIPYKSKLDYIAQKRGFTNYLPGFHIPMLPKKLSEDLCSLKPGICRPALVCQVKISLNGDLIQNSAKFVLAWIKSKDKLIYENVSNWLNNIGLWKPKNEIVSDQLYLLNELCKVRNKWRKKNTIMFKEKLEYKFIFNANNKVINIVGEYRRVAHRIIEEAMIIANICAAEFLSKKIGYGIYNMHIGYDTIRIEQIISIFKNYGININIYNFKNFLKLNKILNNLKNRYLNNRMQKFQSYSEFSIKPKPHFGLGVNCYATWTSPIRKYGDMINHRLIKAVIMNLSTLKLTNSIINKINYCKRKNKMAERDVSNWLYMNYLKKFINKKEIFKGEIIDIMKEGMKISLVKNGAIVFIPSYFLHNVPSEIICNKIYGIIYIQNKPSYYVSDIIKVFIADIKEDSKTIIARPYCK